MTNPYDGNDLVSPELAERLAKLGVMQSYRPLAVYANSESTLIVLESNFNGRWHCFDLEGRTGFWFTEDTLRQRWTWLPRRIDLEAELGKRGCVVWSALERGRGLCLVYKEPKLEGDPVAGFHNTTVAEAIGEALEWALDQAMKSSV